MVPVKVSRYYITKQCNKIPSLTTNQNKAIYLTICKTEFRENICLEITWPDGRLLECGERL